MMEWTCPNCSKPYQVGDEVCGFCGFVFPFSTVILTSGTLLHGRYEIQELIHTGGMDYVYLAAIYAPSSPAIGKDGTVYIGASKMLNAISVMVAANIPMK